MNLEILLVIERNGALYERQFVRLIIELRNRKVYNCYFNPFCYFSFFLSFLFFKPALCILRGLINHLIMEQLCEQTLKMMMMIYIYMYIYMYIFENIMIIHMHDGSLHVWQNLAKAIVLIRKSCISEVRK